MLEEEYFEEETSVSALGQSQTSARTRSKMSQGSAKESGASQSSATRKTTKTKRGSKGFNMQELSSDAEVVQFKQKFVEDLLEEIPLDQIAEGEEELREIG